MNSDLDNNNNNNNNDDDDESYGDSDFLAFRDIAIDDFRKSGKESKIELIKKMLELRHNMKYNKHLLSVYLKAKQLFDNMVEEHRAQLFYLEEIYRHINNLIRENMSSITVKRKTVKHDKVITELMKDKKRIGLLLKKMRNSYEKLTNIDTVIGVTIDKMNTISFMEDDDNDNDDDDSSDAEIDTIDDDEDDEDDEDEDDEDEDDDDEDDEDEDDEDDDDEDDDDEDDEDDDDDEDDEDDEDEDEDDDDEDDDNEDPLVNFQNSTVNFQNGDPLVNFQNDDNDDNDNNDDDDATILIY